MFLSIPVCSCDLEQINMSAPTENPLAPDTHVSDFTPSRERFSTFLIELCFFSPIPRRDCLILHNFHYGNIFQQRA